MTIDDDIINMYKSGMMIKDIATKYKCERHKISKLLHKHNINTSKHELLCGKHFINTQGDEYVVIKDFVKNGHGMVRIRFLQTSYETDVFSSSAKRGMVKDYYKKTIYGVACKGHVKCKKDTFESLVFHRWSAMISRCYNEHDTNYKNYGSRGVKICDEWLVFENFYNDLYTIKGFDKNKYVKHEIELDKDICGFSKIYSLETCQFVPLDVNRKYQRKNIQPFVAISPNGEKFIFDTQTDCAKQLNLIARNVGKCLHGQLKHHHGYTFKYLEPQTTIPLGSRV